MRLLLDGQQRITSLYGIVRGAPPAFFDGNARAFTDLYFHLGNAEFRFYQPLLMREDPLWINVSDLMQAEHAARRAHHSRFGQLTEFATCGASSSDASTASSAFATSTSTSRR